MTEAKRDGESDWRSRVSMVDGCDRARWELTKPETCWGACKASQRLGCTEQGRCITVELD